MQPPGPPGPPAPGVPPAPPAHGPVGGYGLALPPGVSTDSAYRQEGGSGVEPTGLVGLILGVLSLPLYLCCGGLALVLNMVGLGLGVASLFRVRAAPDRYGSRGVAIAAIAINGLLLLAGAVLVIFMFGMMGFGMLKGP
ncbi:MAG: hypothetical protein IPI67_08765 [Myxococcales bacterium]|nr:hypothetical protein [Myxococcales bacterium]